MVYYPKTDDELKTIAKDLLDEKIFSDRHAYEAPHLMASIFMPLAFMTKEQREQFLDAKPAFVFEYLDKASSAINGYPTFGSMQYLSEDDMKKMYTYYDKMKAIKDDGEKKIAKVEL